MGVRRILITGGAGYIGSVLTHFLLQQGFKVTVIDNFMYGEFPFGGICHNPNLTIINGDARDPRVLEPLVPKCDIVLPLAAIVGAPACDRDVLAALSTNATAVETLTRIMGLDQQLLIPITNSGYGKGVPGAPCTEQSPLRPVSRYGVSKVRAEELAMHRENSISFRLATVFGVSPRMRFDLLVNDFVWRAVHDKAVVLFESHFKRNYIHIRDVVMTFLFGISHFNEMRGQIYNVGLSSANLSKKELCAVIAKHVPGFTYVEAPIGKDPDQRDYIVSNAKLEALGWRPSYTLDDGIKELIKACACMKKVQYGNV